jgi:hypothetical protein
MVILGVDAHERTHTVVAADDSAAGLARGRSALPAPIISFCCAGRSGSEPVVSGRSGIAGTCPAVGTRPAHPGEPDDAREPMSSTLSRNNVPSSVGIWVRRRTTCG